MKKLTAIILALVLCLSCVSAFAGEKLSIIATPTPHAEILDLIADDLAALGYDLETTVVTDYVVENPATSDGSVQANFFQHKAYLAGYNASVSEAEQLVAVVDTHFEALALYCGTKTKLEDLTKGDKIVIPNDPANRTRALVLLRDAGLITIPEDTTSDSQIDATDIVDNPLGLDVFEANAELIPNLRDDAAFLVINGNNAALAELNPVRDGVFIESIQPEYVNVIAVRAQDADADFVKALQKVCYSQKVYDLIVERGFVPVFTVAE